MSTTQPLTLQSIHALSRHEAARGRWQPTDALISISSPEEALRVIRPPTLWGAGAILWVAFHDIDEPLDTPCGVWEPIASEQADAMVDFVRTIMTQAHRLIIHCEEGRSRSVATAVTFADLLHIPIIELHGQLRPFSADHLTWGQPLVRQHLRAAWTRVAC